MVEDGHLEAEGEDGKHVLCAGRKKEGATSCNVKVQGFCELLDDAQCYPALPIYCSGSIVSGYGLDDRAIGVRSPAGAKDFSTSLRVQTGSGAHPTSCTMGTGGRFPGGKSAAGAWRWPLTPSSVEVENE
jgi:hypothetical protein